MKKTIHWLLVGYSWIQYHIGIDLLKQDKIHLDNQNVRNTVLVRSNSTKYALKIIKQTLRQTCNTGHIPCLREG